ncbi:MAG: hypothetical protein AAFR36_08095 [Bacteroidota bacterium]
MNTETNRPDPASGLYEITVSRRWKKMLVRWILGAGFFIWLWYLSWVRILFWISLPIELFLLAITLLVYFKLRPKVQQTVESPDSSLLGDNE